MARVSDTAGNTATNFWSANNRSQYSVYVYGLIRLLRNSLIMLPKQTTKLKDQFNKKGYQVGATVRVQKDFRGKVGDGRFIQRQPRVDLETSFTVDKQKNFAFEDSLVNIVLNTSPVTDDRYVAPSIVQMATKIDREAADILRYGAYFTAGTPGSAAGDFDTITKGKAKQNILAVPEMMRRLVLEPNACGDLSSEIVGLESGTMVNNVYGRGYKGPVNGYRLYESNNLPTHKVGQWKASADADTEPEVKTALTEGATSVVVDTLPASTANAVRKGDIFTIEDVFAVNPQHYDLEGETGILQEFICTEDATSNASGEATVKFEPEINAGRLTKTIDYEGTSRTISLSAFKNVSALPAANKKVVFQGDPGATYEINFMYIPSALGFVMLPMAQPVGGVNARRMTVNIEGAMLSLLMSEQHDILEGVNIVRFDVLYGLGMLDPRLCMRLWGKKRDA